MTKILDSQYKAIDKAKDLLQLVKIRGKFELEVIKLYACYNVDEVVNVQKEILTRSQVKKLVNYAKTIKKDINNKNKNSRFAVTKCHNAMIKTNYK